MKFFINLLFLFLVHCATTIEFIPDSDYTEIYPLYKLTSYNQVEIHFKKPKDPIYTYGKILVRDFQDDPKVTHGIEEIKEKLFSLKMDGVWFEKSEQLEVAPFIFQTKTEQGIPTSYAETNREMTRLIGYPFRYKKYVRKR